MAVCMVLDAVQCWKKLLAGIFSSLETLFSWKALFRFSSTEFCTFLGWKLVLGGFLKFLVLRFSLRFLQVRSSNFSLSSVLLNSSISFSSLEWTFSRQGLFPATSFFQAEAFSRHVPFPASRGSPYVRCRHIPALQQAS